MMNYNNKITPNISDFIDLLIKYGNNNRIMSFNIQQHIPRKNNLYKIIKLDIITVHAVINNIDLNKLLKNLIILTSDIQCQLGNYSEYIRYKHIYDIVYNDKYEDLPSGREGEIARFHGQDENIKKFMLKEINLKIDEYSIENEFKNNKILHNLSKNIFLFLTNNSIECTEFYNDTLKQLKGKKQGIYVAPVIKYNEYKYNNEQKNNKYVKCYTNDHPSRTGETHIHGNRFIDIKDVTECPSINNINDFPFLSK